MKYPKVNALLKCSLLTLFLSALIACHPAGSSEQPAASTAPLGASPSGAHHHAKGAVIAKPGASVAITNLQPIKLSSAGIQTLVLDIASEDSAGVMNIRLSGSPGVNLLAPTEPAQFALTERGKYQLPVQFALAREGRHYLRLHVSLEREGQVEHRVVSAILQLGQQPLKANKTSPSEPSDEVISMPAQERVGPRD